MTRIRLAVPVVFISTVILWLIAGGANFDVADFWQWRSAVLYLSGLLAIIPMILGVILATRWEWLNRSFNGLDKSYRLHKWLGIMALVFAVVHWLAIEAKGFVIDMGWLASPARQPQPAPDGVLLQWLESLESLGEQAGEIGFYAIIFLIVVALVKRVPYRWFFLSHRFLLPVFLLLAFHTVVLMPGSWWSHLLAWATLALLLMGVAACVDILLNQSRKRRTVAATISKLQHYADNQVLEVNLSTQEDWAGHRAGQFAFVTFDPKEGPHPFSLSHSWHNDGQLQFMIKGLGDYTSTLPERLQEGQQVSVEGPYGCFDFEHAGSVQVWIAGGIGIAPFIARARQLITNPQQGEIHLFYSTQMPDQQFIAQTQALAAKAGITLHVINTLEQPKLTSAFMCEQVRQWQEASWWFCGPAQMGSALKRDLVNAGVHHRAFHSELFHMR